MASCSSVTQTASETNCDVALTNACACGGQPIACTPRDSRPCTLYLSLYQRAASASLGTPHAAEKAPTQTTTKNVYLILHLSLSTRVKGAGKRYTLHRAASEKKYPREI